MPEAVLAETPLPATGSSPAVDRDGAVLAELLLGLVHLTDEVDEAFPRLWHALLRPVRELKLPDRPRLPILGEVAGPGVRAGLAAAPGQVGRVAAQLSTLRPSWEMGLPPPHLTLDSYGWSGVPCRQPPPQRGSDSVTHMPSCTYTHSPVHSPGHP